MVVLKGKRIAGLALVLFVWGMIMNSKPMVTVRIGQMMKICFVVT